MKIKCRPDDFLVDECIDLPVAQSGKYAVYQAQKENMTTFALIDLLAEWTHKSPRLFSHAGLKDKYGKTSQFISLKGDGPGQISTTSFSAKRIGYATEALTAKHLLGNSFRIVVRDLSETRVANFTKNLPQIKKCGFLNYFDDQRFRSQRSAQNIFGFALFRKEFESALKIYITDVLPVNKKIKPALLDQVNANWGDWQKLARLELPGRLRPAVSHLRSTPNDFQGAVYKLDYFDLRLMISAAQSFLWNELLAEYLSLKFPDSLKKVDGAWQDYLVISSFDGTICRHLTDSAIQIPHANWQSDSSDLKNCLQKILNRYKLQLKDLQLPGIRKIFAEDFVRKVLILPENLNADTPEMDELYPKRYKVTLSFKLPPGSYATMVLKQLFSG